MKPTRFQAHSRPTMGVEIDPSRLPDCFLDLRPFDDGPQRRSYDFLSVEIDLEAVDGSYKVCHGIRGEGPAWFTSLGAAIANAVARCAAILETTLDEMDGLTADIHNVLAARQAERSDLHNFALGS